MQGSRSTLTSESQFTPGEWEQTSDFAFEVPVGYDLLKSLRFTRLGKSEPTAVLSNKESRRAFWYHARPAMVEAFHLENRLIGHVRGPGRGLSQGAFASCFGVGMAPYAIDGHLIMSRQSR
jgi:hypothetical protein